MSLNVNILIWYHTGYGTVNGHKCDHEGKIICHSNSIIIIGTYLYEVELYDGTAKSIHIV